MEANRLGTGEADSSSGREVGPDEVNFITSSNVSQQHLLELPRELEVHVRNSRLSELMQRLLDSYAIAMIIIIGTIHSLIGDDIRMAAFDKSDDGVFFIISTIVISLFSLELVGTCIAHKCYTWSYYF